MSKLARVAVLSTLAIYTSHAAGKDIGHDEQKHKRSSAILFLEKYFSTVRKYDRRNLIKMIARENLEEEIDSILYADSSMKLHTANFMLSNYFTSAPDCKFSVGEVIVDNVTAKQNIIFEHQPPFSPDYSDSEYQGKFFVPVTVISENHLTEYIVVLSIVDGTEYVFGINSYKRHKKQDQTIDVDIDICDILINWDNPNIRKE